ncbi:MAG: YggS family pyridoxal phosphate-dependent enzyme [Thiothrix sp.]|nr:MAG: YggS family pyridoxal phosphate-dependent enzyme [Thiothrix sp.]
MSIKDNLLIIGERIRAAEAKYGRPAGSVKLLAVSKHQPIFALQEALQAEQWALGENYVQEMAEKAQHLADYPIEWHFIGPIQSNKTRPIAELATWVHSVDRLKIAERLSAQNPKLDHAIQICLQVNISAEDTKSGAPAEKILELAEAVQKLPNLQLRGLMAIPAAEEDFAKQRQAFAAVRALLESLNKQGFQLDTLSMGMTNDLEAAIAEGSSIVRIGTAIFGARPSTMRIRS